MRSKSVPQLSSIVMIFEPGTDLLDARQLVQERLATVAPTLPSWTTPPVMIQPLSATSRTMKIGLSSDTVDLIDLSVMARWKIRPRLWRSRASPMSRSGVSAIRCCTCMWSPNGWPRTG